MTSLTLPTGEVIAHDSAKRFHTIVAGRGRVASSEERSRALSQWRRWRRNTPDRDVWLIDGETGGVVRGPESPVHPAAAGGVNVVSVPVVDPFELIGQDLSDIDAEHGEPDQAGPIPVVSAADVRRAMVGKSPDQRRALAAAYLGRGLR